MAIIEKEFSLDIVPGYTPPVIHVSEYDVGRSYSVSILNDGVSLNLHPNLIATIDGTVEDFINHSEKIVKAVFKDISANIEDNKVIFNLTEEMTAYKGRVWCKIKLKTGKESISTCGFILDVDRAGAEAGAVLNSPGFMEQVAQATSRWILNNATGVVSGPVTEYLSSQDPQTVVVSAILLAAHPVGSYYWSDNPTDPSGLFGGTWERVTGVFLYAADSDKQAGTTGGEVEHTLTIDEMPSHSHRFFRQNWYSSDSVDPKGATIYSWPNETRVAVPKCLGSDAEESYQYVGGGVPHNNMPPYLSAYCWKRIA